MSTIFSDLVPNTFAVPPMLTRPSPATRRVLDAIVSLWRTERRGLSATEVAIAAVQSKQSVLRHVKKLELSGHVTRSGVHYGIIPIYDAEGAIVGDDVRLPHRSADSPSTPRIVEIAEHLCVDATTGETIELTADVPELGLSAGEILVIDVKTEPKRRDIVAWSDEGHVRVSRYSSRAEPVIGIVRTVIRRVR